MRSVRARFARPHCPAPPAAAGVTRDHNIRTDSLSSTTLTWDLSFPPSYIKLLGSRCLTHVDTEGFPNLARCQVCKLGPATTAYNCVGYTIGDTTHWIWSVIDTNTNGMISVSELNAYYTSQGVSNIWYYGFSTSDVQHVAKKSGGMGPDCPVSSKMGQGILMSHDKDQIQGDLYGNIVGGN